VPHLTLCFFCLVQGSMNLRNLHNEAYIAVYERGNVNVQGMDGSANIFVKQVTAATSSQHVAL
jgi:hypothetical protein